MELNENAYNQIKKLDKDERFQYFFNNLEKPIPDTQEDAIKRIASALITQFQLDWNSFDAVRFFLKLAYHAHP